MDPQSRKGGFLGDVRTRDQLQQYLQYAIELELSTLPPYLSALYSMNPNSGHNEEIIALIRSIVHQEMTHLALACNLLRSIGGKPRIAYKDVVGEQGRCSFPRTGLVKAEDLQVYVLPDLKLTLAPMRVKKEVKGKLPVVAQPLRTFLQIEEPADFELDTLLIDEPYYFSDAKEASMRVANAVAQPHLDSVLKGEHLMFEAAAPDTKAVLSRTLFESKPLLKLAPLLLANVQEQAAEAKTPEFTKTTLKFKSRPADDLKKQSDDGDSGDEKVSGDAVKGAAEYSIGGFYELVRKGFVYLSTHPEALNDESDEKDQESETNSSLFVVDSQDEALKTQIGSEMMQSCNVVYNLQTALTAIETIVSEGEGTSMTDLQTSGGLNGSLSHFHKFLEIAKQRALLKVQRNENPKPGVFPYSYVFSKDVTIKFDESGVWDDPEAWDWLDADSESFGKYADEPRVQRFNRDYGRLLLNLQQVFGNGNKAKFNSAIGLMRQLQIDFNDCLCPERRTTKASQKQKIAPNWVPPNDLLLEPPNDM